MPTETQQQEESDETTVRLAALEDKVGVTDKERADKRAQLMRRKA